MGYRRWSGYGGKEMKKWKEFAFKYPRIYLLTCWLGLGLAGTLLGLGTEVTVLGILILGYMMNVIWMMRQ